MIENLDYIKHSLNITEIISTYIPLKKQGANYIAKCPFHHENTASLSVCEAKNIFHCFGCNEGGNGIDFIMKYERLDFNSAVKKAASICNIQVEHTDNKSTMIQEKLEAFYYKSYKALLANDKLLKYLEKRGFHKDILETYGIGYCIDIKDIENTLGRQLAYNLGILTRKGHSFFKDRLLLCIRDERHRIVGFSGRMHDYANFYKSSKYINSQESFLYKKNSIVYNYSQAYEILRKYKHKKLYIVEGYFDAITCNLLQIPAIAICGANLHVNQLKILSRLLKDDITLHIALDSDDAGRQGSISAYKLLFEHGFIEAKITRLDKAYKDINEFYIKAKIEDQPPFIDYDGLEYCIRVEIAQAKSIREKRTVIAYYQRLLNDARDVFTQKYIATHLHRYAHIDIQEREQDVKDEAWILTQLAQDAKKRFVIQDMLNSTDFKDRAAFSDIVEEKDSVKTRELKLKDTDSMDTERFYKITLRYKMHRLQRQRLQALRKKPLDTSYILSLNEKLKEIANMLDLPF